MVDLCHVCSFPHPAIAETPSIGVKSGAHGNHTANRCPLHGNDCVSVLHRTVPERNARISQFVRIHPSAGLDKPPRLEQVFG